MQKNIIDVLYFFGFNCFGLVRRVGVKKVADGLTEALIIKCKNVPGTFNFMLKQLVIVMAIFVLAVSGCSKREPESKDSDISRPRYAARLICYLREIGAGSNCSAEIYVPKDTNVVVSDQKLSCGHPGKVSEITWKFVACEGAKDVYSFERLFPKDTSESTLSSQVVAFEGKPVVIFKDEYQKVVIEPAD